MHAARVLAPFWHIFDAQHVTNTISKVNAGFIDTAYAPGSDARFKCFVYRELVQLLVGRIQSVYRE
jgi:hypothetical protein